VAAPSAQTGPYGVTQGNPTPFLARIRHLRSWAVTGCGTVPMAGVVRTLSAPFHGYDFVAKGDITLG